MAAGGSQEQVIWRDMELRQSLVGVLKWGDHVGFRVVERRRHIPADILAQSCAALAAASLSQVFPRSTLISPSADLAGELCRHGPNRLTGSYNLSAVIRVGTSAAVNSA
jgi:hypothetical protein